jgi:hypothetical protein
MPELKRHLYLLGKYCLTSNIECTTWCSPLRTECFRQRNNMYLSTFSNSRNNQFRKSKAIVQNKRDTGNCLENNAVVRILSFLHNVPVWQLSVSVKRILPVSIFKWGETFTLQKVGQYCRDLCTCYENTM